MNEEETKYDGSENKKCLNIFLSNKEEQVTKREWKEDERKERKIENKLFHTTTVTEFWHCIFEEFCCFLFLLTAEWKSSVITWTIYLNNWLEQFDAYMNHLSSKQRMSQFLIIA